MERTWIKDNTYYNTDVVTCDVYRLDWNKVRKIYIMDSKDKNFQYTFSCGSNSDYSFSGSFYQCSTINSLEDAQAWIINFAKAWFADDMKKIRELKDSLK